MEETQKKTRLQVKKSRCEMATTDRDRMVSKYTSRQESCDTNTKVFKDNRNRGKRGARERGLK